MMDEGDLGPAVANTVARSLEARGPVGSFTTGGAALSFTAADQRPLLVLFGADAAAVELVRRIGEGTHGKRVVVQLVEDEAPGGAS